MEVRFLHFIQRKILIPVVFLITMYMVIPGEATKKILKNQNTKKHLN